jgi:hypothetical protein
MTMRDRCPKGYKIRYASYRDAQLALIDIILYVNIYGDDPHKRSHWKKAEKRKEKRLYDCRACGGYHLTSHSLRRKAVIE